MRTLRLHRNFSLALLPRPLMMIRVSCMKLGTGAELSSHAIASISCDTYGNTKDEITAKIAGISGGWS